MNDKLNNLIHIVEKIHHKISKKYRNIELIEGQYKPKVKTIAKILRLQIENKFVVYNTLLMEDSIVEIDISDSGYQEMLNMTKKCEKELTKNMVLLEKDIITTAIEFTRIKIDLFSSVLDLLNRCELEKNIIHGALKEKMLIIIALEKKDLETLRSFEIKEAKEQTNVVEGVSDF